MVTLIRWRLIVEYEEENVGPRIMTFLEEDGYDSEVEHLTSKDYLGPKIHAITGMKIRMVEQVVATYNISPSVGRTSKV